MDQILHLTLDHPIRVVHLVVKEEHQVVQMVHLEINHQEVHQDLQEVKIKLFIKIRIYLNIKEKLMKKIVKLKEEEMKGMYYYKKKIQRLMMKKWKDISLIIEQSVL